MFVFQIKQVIMLARAMAEQNNLFNLKNRHILDKISTLTSRNFNNKFSRFEIEISFFQIQNMFVFQIKQVIIVARAMAEQNKLFNLKNRYILGKI
jgi:hypothetical protein